MRWSTAVGVQTRRSVILVSRRRLLELAMAAGGGIALAHCRWSSDICKCQLGQKEAPIGAGDAAGGGSALAHCGWS